MHLHRISIVALLAIAGFIASPLQAQTRIGIINLKQAYSNMQETIDSDHELTSLRGQLDELVKFHHDELDALGREVQKRNSTRTAADVDAKRLEYDLREQTTKVKMVRLQSRQLKKAYDEIHAAVIEVVRQKNLELVLSDNDAELPANDRDILNSNDLAGLIFNRSVMYASDDLDITAEVIALLNKDYQSPFIAPALPTTSLQVGSKKYQIEIAADDPSREHGLMERNSMPADHGMIFVFPDTQVRSFWMHHTRFPLDILFVDDRGKIVSTFTMKPYDETGISSDFPAKYAIELSAGEVNADGIKPGDVLSIPSAATASLKR